MPLARVEREPAITCWYLHEKVLPPLPFIVEVHECNQCHVPDSDPDAAFGILQVVTQARCIGTIDGSFGKSGKFKVSFQMAIPLPEPGCNTITLTFKRYIYDPNKKALYQ